MPKIFICYRRADVGLTAGFIRDRLVSHFGESDIFLDIDTTLFGADFRREIYDRVGHCDYLIALIGKHWLAIRDEQGRRRLDNPSDWVRLEIQAALERNIPVIPLLLEDAAMPNEDELPSCIGHFAYRRAHTIHLAHRQYDIDKLIDNIKQQEESKAAAQESLRREEDRRLEKARLEEEDRQHRAAEARVQREEAERAARERVEKEQREEGDRQQRQAKEYEKERRRQEPAPKLTPTFRLASGWISRVSPRLHLPRPGRIYVLQAKAFRSQSPSARVKTVAIEAIRRARTSGEELLSPNSRVSLNGVNWKFPHEFPRLLPTTAFDVFIICASADYEIGKRIQARLRRAGIYSYLVPKTSLSKTSITKEMACSLRGSLIVLFLASKWSCQNRMGKKQLLFAIRKKKRIITLCLDAAPRSDSDLSLTLAGSRWIDTGGDWRAHTGKLKQIIETEIGVGVAPNWVRIFPAVLNALIATTRRAMRRGAGPLRFDTVALLVAAIIIITIGAMLALPSLKDRVRSFVPRRFERLTIAAPQSVSVAPGTPFFFTGSNAIKVIDSAETTERLRLAVSCGTLSLAMTNGLTIAGNGTKEVIATGPLAKINDALSTLNYTSALRATKDDLVLSDAHTTDNRTTLPRTVAITVEPAAPYSGTHAGQTRNDNRLNMPLVWIPPGEFQMGSPKSEEGHRDEENQVRVILTKGFWLAQHEVTQGEWEKVMKTSPWIGGQNVKKGANYPATYVSWKDGIKFCEQLTEQERTASRLPPEWRYTLPTEAQWEYACRAGTKSKFSCGDDDSTLGDYSWFTKNTNGAGEEFAHEVGNKKPNPWGLYDMHGNVFEWCSDFYVEKLPGGVDPRGPSPGSSPVNRGGAWNSEATSCRSAYRRGRSPEDRGYYLGFRVAAVPSGEKGQ